MDCGRSLELLSDFREGSLEEPERVEVREHLDACRPCANIFQDLDLIVVTAQEIRTVEDFTFPDEDALWQRIYSGGRPIH